MPTSMNNIHTMTDQTASPLPSVAPRTIKIEWDEENQVFKTSTPPPTLLPTNKDEWTEERLAPYKPAFGCGTSPGTIPIDFSLDTVYLNDPRPTKDQHLDTTSILQRFIGTFHWRKTRFLRLDSSAFIDEKYPNQQLTAQLSEMEAYLFGIPYTTQKSLAQFHDLQTLQILIACPGHALSLSPAAREQEVEMVARLNFHLKILTDCFRMRRCGGAESVDRSLAEELFGSRIRVPLFGAEMVDAEGDRCEECGLVMVEMGSWQMDGTQWTIEEVLRGLCREF